MEDDAGFVKALTRLLREEGFLVHTARNGDDALALLHDYPYDLLLCALPRPGRDGRDFYVLLRQYPFLLPRVIFLTGDTVSLQRMPCRVPGDQPWVSQPCTATAVRSAMAQVLSTRDHERPSA